MSFSLRLRLPSLETARLNGTKPAAIY
jgi:hypothetical protein